MSGSTGSSGDSELQDRRRAVWLSLITFFTYAYFFAGGGWNQNAQFDLTRAIVERHTFAIDAYVVNTGDVSRANGHVYANKPPALSWIAAIPYAALHAMESDPDLVLTLNVYFCTLVCVALPGALIPAMLFLAARRRGFDARWAALVSLGVALGTQLLPYATIFMLHVPSAALMLFALTSPRRGMAGFAAGLATAMNYLCTPALVFLFLGGQKRRFAAGALVPLLALAAYQRLAFGSVFASSLRHEDARFLSPHAIFGIINPPSLDAAIGITISPYRGLFFFAPLLLVAFFGIAAWWRAARGECIAALATIAVFFGFNITFNGWEGGFGIGARYLVPVIPLFGIAILYARRVELTAVVAALSFAINFAAAAVDPQPSADIPRPLTQYILPLLIDGHFSPRVPLTPPWSAATFTGHTSVNRMTLDEAVVFTRHPPGSDESEWASFNLGEFYFGPGDARSLIPILLLIAISAAIVIKEAARPR